VRRFILDTGIAGLYLDRKRGVFDRAAAEVAAGNRVGRAIALTLGDTTVVTMDVDLSAVPGLSFENWAEPV